MNLDTLLMETFITVAREKNFRRAAKLLNVSQPTVTLRIKALEQSVGAELLNRSDNQISLTPTGNLVISYIERILFVISDVKDHLSGIASSSNRFSIAAIPSFCTYAFPTILQEKNALEQTQFTIQNVSSSKVLHLVSDGAVDYGIMRGPINKSVMKNIGTKVLYSERIYLAKPKKHCYGLNKDKIYIEDILEQNIITFERRFWSFFKNRILELGHHFNEQIIADSEITAKKLVAEGLGVTLLPEFSIRNNDDKYLSFQEIEDFDVSRSAYFVYRKGINEHAAEKFFNWVQKCLNGRSKFDVHYER